MPYQVFETAPDSEACPSTSSLRCGNDGQFAKFCDVAGCPEIARDERYARNQNRVRHRETLVPLLETLMKTRTKPDWLAALEAAKVPCGAINNLAEVFADPHVQQRAMVHTWNHPLAESVDLVASPMKLSATPVRTDLPPPLLGQHSAEVLQDWLGAGADRLSELRQRGIV